MYFTYFLGGGGGWSGKEEEGLLFFGAHFDILMEALTSSQQSWQAHCQ